MFDTKLVRRDSLAAPRRADAIEAAIVEHRRVLLQRYPGVGSFADSPAGELRVWPLQLIFHNVGWYRPRPFAWCKSRGPNALIRG